MIELNADIGEGCDDAGLMPYLNRVSIACGGHTGDAASMRAALQLAADHGVAVGAHPSYPDRAQFGRRALAASNDEVAAWVTQQTERLAEQAARLGIPLAHVKPHGALYNVAARDLTVARAIAQAVADFDSALIVLGLSGSHLVAAGQTAGLVVMNEVFADRRYQTNGQLVSRETNGALIVEPAAAAAQAELLAQGRAIGTLNGGRIRVQADTVCLHGDTPGALNIARAVHAVLNRG
ncbi:MAG TPA: 5-oxoprolinase subunit PxpA [Thiobacillus sp.]|nr:MAG: lactam utilization protein LamB [Hydrogenophilales bacterium 28-61-11]OYZ58515.1 MAG: lactam utilization protein LamB [Hydrogenophilales bacterium 16-61-112]OZA49352.1 MAG: lactam utilization protein LamB [Hydrogenophilales bacterium 17-61-76]HQT29642.1 5-oxoprolinase subunit PxpA [Thiobacillus sp.]HQT70222.1 5-oxoprolinase subunit PxpA [Thiobacillus sp.]